MSIDFLEIHLAILLFKSIIDLGGRNMPARIKVIRKFLGMSQRAFGESLGVSRDTISNIEQGRQAISNTLVRLICKTYNISEVWLRTGEGTMINTSDAAITCSAEELNGIKKYRALDEHGKKLVNLILTEEYLRVQKTNFEPK